MSRELIALLNADFLVLSFKLGIHPPNCWYLAWLRGCLGDFCGQGCDLINFECPTKIQTVCLLVASPVVAYLKPLVVFQPWVPAAGTRRGCHRCAGSGNSLFRHFIVFFHRVFSWETNWKKKHEKNQGWVGFCWHPPRFCSI